MRFWGFFAGKFTACITDIPVRSVKSLISVHKSHKNIEHRLTNNDF